MESEFLNVDDLQSSLPIKTTTYNLLYAHPIFFMGAGASNEKRQQNH